MDIDRAGQKWVLDAFLSFAGLNILHPGAGAVFEQFGYNRLDLEAVFSQVKSARMLPSAWSRVATKIENRAIYWESRSCTQAARTMYERAMLLYGRAYYSLQDDLDIRADLLRRMKRCFGKVSSLIPTPVNHVSLPFNGGFIHGIFECEAASEKAPCIITIPGMDMFKEDWHSFIQNSVLPRGWVAFSLDCPGQGETRAGDVKMTLDNCEYAVAIVIDWLEKRPEVDPEKIVVLGVSLGSWWGCRIAAAEPRVKATVGAMAAISDDKKQLIFQAQPSFTKNLKFMTGISDVEELIAFVEGMDLSSIAPKVKSPFLLISGEYDELTGMKATRATFDKFSGPKEFWIYGDEFHSLGPTSHEWLTASLDWLGLALTGKFDREYGRKVFIDHSAGFIEGNGTPPWMTDSVKT